MTRLPAQPACPCGRLGAAGKLLAFSDCCGLFINDFAATPAPDAESLMRSRYTAFVQERADYLLATWHVSCRPQGVDFDAGVKWLGLEVRQHAQCDDAQAEVEFIARHKSAGLAAVRLHERSRFVREEGRWHYAGGNVFHG